ncbi:MAG: hypothetical protein GY781_16440 [Gammaproteobacteria bacterium]|nr:hypothetical protein [Gammaproteobacteria bacterium]
MTKRKITPKTLGMMFLLVFVVTVIKGVYEYRSFKLREIEGIVTSIVWVSDFHAMPEITIKNELGKTWILHSSKFSEEDFKVGYLFIKRKGSTQAYVNGTPVNMGWSNFWTPGVPRAGP